MSNHLLRGKSGTVNQGAVDQCGKVDRSCESLLLGKYDIFYIE